MENIRSKIFSKTNVKKINNRNVNGNIFLDMIKQYIQIVNDGNVPNLDNTWTYLCDQENQRAMEFTIQQIQEELKNLAHKDNMLNMNENEIQNVKVNIQRKSMQLFQTK